MKLQRTAILFLVLALVVGLEGVLINRLTRPETASRIPVSTPVSSPEGENPVTPTAVPTVVPTMPGYTSPPGGGSSGSSSNNNSSSNRNSSSNNNSSSSSATQKPKPTAAPTKKPDPTAVPGTSLGSGSFSSNTGTALNMSVSWEARDQGNGKSRIYINGSVNSYTLSVMSQPVSISYSDYSTSLMGSSIDVSTDGMKNTSLFSTYMDVPTGTEGTMTVTWKYNGTYHDVKLETVTASGSVHT